MKHIENCKGSIMKKQSNFGQELAVVILSSIYFVALTFQAITDEHHTFWSILALIQLIVTTYRLLQLLRRTYRQRKK